MTPAELRTAMKSYEDMEYHFTGRETNFAQTNIIPGWYPCTIYDIKRNGNVEIGVTTPAFLALEVTVLKRNIPIAFRRKAEVQQ